MLTIEFNRNVHANFQNYIFVRKTEVHIESNSPLREVPILKRDVIVENHCLIQYVQ